MPTPEHTYRSLMIRKIQRISQEHGGLPKIPRKLQKELGFDVIAKRKGYSTYIILPLADLSERISELKRELSQLSFHFANPDTEPIFGKCTPIALDENPTMDDFWIAQGWYKEDRIGIKLTPAKWQDDEKVRVASVRFLVNQVLQKDPRCITQDDFKANRLGGLMAGYYTGSPYKAFLEAGYMYSVEESLKHAQSGKFKVKKIYPWELAKTPEAFSYKKEQNRVAAVRWLIYKVKKDPRDIEVEDFSFNYLGGLLGECYENSRFKAFQEAGYTFHPWEMRSSPNSIYLSKEGRVAAVRWLIQKLQKAPRDTIQDDFYNNRLGGLLKNHHNCSPFEALLEAELVTDMDEEYMRRRGGERFKNTA